MPAPSKPLIVRSAGREENTTLWTLLPTTKPLAPAAVPDPSNASPAPTKTRPARATVIPWRGSLPPMSPAIVIARAADRRSRPNPSIVDAKEMAPPAWRATPLRSVTGPANACEPPGVVTPAARRIPRATASPVVARLTAPAPFVVICPPTTMVSASPGPVSIVKLCAAAPRTTAARFTPPRPMLTESVPAPPTIERPANLVIFFRSTVIVSAPSLTKMPLTGSGMESVPAVAAVIVSLFAAVS